MDKQFVRRATEDDIPFMDSVINHPAVRPFMGEGDHPMSCGVTFEGSLYYVSDYGVVLLQGLSDTVAVALVAFTPDAPPVHPMLAMVNCIDKVFSSTQYDRVIATVNDNNSRMIRAASRLGFSTPIGVNDHYALSLEFMPWAIRNPGCIKRGMEVYEKVGGDDHYNTLGALGGFCKSAENGLIAKGVAMFNTYAALARINPIRIVGEADRIFYGDKEITDFVFSLSGA